MNTREISEYNELCARFLGYKYYPHPEKNAGWRKETGHLKIKDYYLARTTNKLSFHYDWNMIMKVINNIEKTYDNFHGYFAVYISSNNCTIQGTKLRTTPENFHPAYFSEITLDSKLESTIYCIYLFLKWYNEQKLSELCNTN